MKFTVYKVKATYMGKAETSDSVGLLLEILLISRSEHIGMQNILDPCIYIRSGHIAKN
jgi:hypothetical protein